MYGNANSRDGSRNYMGYDAMAIGNHDFDFPQDVMERNAGLADFPFLSANTYRDGRRPEYLIPSAVVTAAGRSFGIVGLTDDRSAVYTHPNNVKGITYKNHLEAAAEEVESIRDKVDVVIALAHLHGDNCRDCPNCGTHHDRDINASRNILEEGLRVANTV